MLVNRSQQKVARRGTPSAGVWTRTLWRRSLATPTSTRSGSWTSLTVASGRWTWGRGSTSSTYAGKLHSFYRTMDVRVQIFIWFQTFLLFTNPIYRLLMQFECIEKHIFSGISDYFRLFLTPLLCAPGRRTRMRAPGKKTDNVRRAWTIKLP